MSMKILPGNRLWLLILLLAIQALTSIQLRAEPDFPTLSGRVVDDANLLSVEVENKLTQQLQSYEAKTTNQVVVVTLKSLEGYDIAEYGYQLGRHWGIGQTGKNNGVLLIVAPTERKVRIEVGYGLEAQLTDALCKQIIDYKIIPYFKQKDYAGGIRAGVNAILGILGGSYDVTELRQSSTTTTQDQYPLFFIFLIIAIILGEFIATFLGTVVSTGSVFAIGLGVGRWLSGSWGLGLLAAVVASVFHLFSHISGRGGGGGFGGGGYYGGGYSSGGFSSGGFSGGGGSFGGGGASGGW